jgi:hypothetical protein
MHHITFLSPPTTLITRHSPLTTVRLDHVVQLATDIIQPLALYCPGIGSSGTPGGPGTPALLVLLLGRALYRVVHCYVHRMIVHLNAIDGEKPFTRFKIQVMSDGILDLLTHPSIQFLMDRCT